MAIEHGYTSVSAYKEYRANPKLDEEDPMVERAIEASSRAIEHRTRRRFWREVDGDGEPVATTRVFDDCGPARLYVDDFTEIVAVTPESSFNVLGTLVDPTTYRPGPANAPVDGRPYTYLEGSFGWWWGTRLHVEAFWGWPAIPAGVTQACLLMTDRVLKRRESPNAVVGFDELAFRISREDPDVVNLLEPYCLLDGLVA